jgi:hypothetical protein
MTALKARNDIMRKIASFREVQKLIVNTPRDMAFKVAGELIQNELNFGGTENTTVKIGRISGNLARSFGADNSGNPKAGFDRVHQNGPYEWAVVQTQAIAPYAGDVAVYSMRRWGMTYLDSVRRRTHDFLLKEAIDEFEYAMKLISAGKSFTYHPLYGE